MEVKKTIIELNMTMEEYCLIGKILGITYKMEKEPTLNYFNLSEVEMYLLDELNSKWH